jgi:hypothetical protein
MTLYLFVLVPFNLHYPFIYFAFLALKYLNQPLCKEICWDEVAIIMPSALYILKYLKYLLEGEKNGSHGDAFKVE